MSRSGYSDGEDENGSSDGEDENGSFAMYRGVIASATRGKRGQAFFRDLVAALDAMPEKRLVANELETKEGAVCALGALGKHKGIEVKGLDTYDCDALGETFDIAHQLAAETMYENDEACYGTETPEHRWARVRAWAAKQILNP